MKIGLYFPEKNMTTEEMDRLRFPIGPFTAPNPISQEQVDAWTGQIEAFPSELIALVEPLGSEELNWRYRPGGWNIREVVHHCADSHLNSVARFKLALTEDKPVIRPYFEDRWVKLADAATEDLEATFLLLRGVHAKLGVLIRSMNPADLDREFVHPEHGRSFSLRENVGVYAWHGQHHLAHIRQALQHRGAFD